LWLHLNKRLISFTSSNANPDFVHAGAEEKMVALLK